MIIDGVVGFIAKLSWTLLRRTAIALLPKASIGLVLVYVVFYLKVGGFSTAPLEVTLAGSLVLLLSCAAIQAAVPRLISRFDDEYKYEEYLHALVKEDRISLTHCCSPLLQRGSNAGEARELEFEFDQKFGFSLDDLRASLGDTGLVTYVARATFLRTNTSRPAIRSVLAAAILAGLLLMYWKPLYMIYFIYFGERSI